MSNLLRSEKMVLLQLFLHPEHIYFIMAEMGEAGFAHFVDLNPELSAKDKPFINEVIKCSNMERRLVFIRNEMTKCHLKIKNSYNYPATPHVHEIIDLDNHLESVERQLLLLKENVVRLKKQRESLIEYYHVLKETKQCFTRNRMTETDELLLQQHQQQMQLLSQGEHHMRIPLLQHITGIIALEKSRNFEVLVTRLAKRNLYVKTIDIYEPIENGETEQLEYKAVFVIFFRGEHLRAVLRKVCEAFNATLYSRPTSEYQAMSLINSISVQLEDLKVVIDRSQLFRTRYLEKMTDEWQNWNAMALKIKSIFHIMNFLNTNVTIDCLIGECWIPADDEIKMADILHKSSKEGVSISTFSSFYNIIETTRQPPTFNKTTSLTAAFQALIDSYGMASYGEMNPALSATVTFPFLFAVMFGDIGHSIILFAVAGYLIKCEPNYQHRDPENEIGRIFFKGRYLMIFMAAFSFYSGFMYSDVFSKGLQCFRHTWFVNYTVEEVLDIESAELHPGKNFLGVPYPFGIDPVWHIAINKIIYSNSIKMKLSIIFGVLHMIFGLILSLFNYIHFKKYSSIFLEFIPQIIFLCCLFLWLVIMIFLKWILYSANEDVPVEYGTACAPSVLILFINMMLLKSSPVPPGCKEFMFTGQADLHHILLYVALSCVPVLLFGKPTFTILKKKCYKKLKKHVEEESQHGAEEPMSTLDLYTYQAIHTIEFVLGTVSHTASYLRLWALSLAHGQLSEVLWDMVFIPGLIQEPFYVGGPLTFLCFFFWAVLTVAIMVTMEGLSAFLHTLRLHWVEFMSKFYMGTGYIYQPYCFATIIKDSNEEYEGQ